MVGAKLVQLENRLISRRDCEFWPNLFDPTAPTFELLCCFEILKASHLEVHLDRGQRSGLMEKVRPLLRENDSERVGEHPVFAA